MLASLIVLISVVTLALMTMIRAPLCPSLRSQHGRKRQILLLNAPISAPIQQIDPSVKR